MTRLLRACGFPLAWLALVLGAAAAEPAAREPSDRMLGPPFALRARPALGPAEAAVVLIEVSDFGCEHCRQFHERVFPRIKQRFIDTGLIRYVALPAVPQAGAARPPIFALARVAFEAGRFWSARPALYAHATENDFAALARKAGLDPATALPAMRTPAVQAAVEADFREAAALEVSGTPTFILRRRSASGEFVEARVEGYESWEYFQRFISEMLARTDE